MTDQTTTTTKKTSKRRSAKKISSASKSVVINRVFGTAKFGDTPTDFTASISDAGLKIVVKRAAPGNEFLESKLKVAIAESIICLFNKKLADLAREGFAVQIAFDAPAAPVAAEKTAVAAAAPAPVKRVRKSAK